MNLFLFFILVCIIVLIYVLFKQLKKSTFMVLVCSFFIVYFILYPKLCITSTLGGAKLFFNSVFPSLFPFLVICNLLLYYDGISIYSKLFGRYLCIPLKLSKNCSFALIVSALCGYPLGAKYSCELYAKNIISREECQRLLNIASNAGPIFIVGAVGSSMFKSTALGYILLLGNYISCMIMGLIIPCFRGYTAGKALSSENSKPLAVNFGNAIRDSIDNAIKTSLSVGGYITIFSVLIDIIKNNVLYNIVLNAGIISNINKNLLSGTLLGMAEITKGSYLIAGSNEITVFTAFILGFFIGFSGFSIISQVYSFMSYYPELKIALYIKRKLLQGVLCGICSSILFAIFMKEPVKPALSLIPAPRSSTVFMLISLLILLPACLWNLKKLFHIS